MSFSEFYQRSINEPEAFWAEQARRIDWRQPFTQTLDHSRPPFARWFCGGTTNLCHNAVDRWRDKQPEALALIAVSSETMKSAHLPSASCMTRSTLWPLCCCRWACSVAIAYWSICR